MKTRHSDSTLIAACAALIFAGVIPQARAGYLLTIQQTASDVVASGSGTLNISGLSVNQLGAVGYAANFFPSFAQAIVGFESMKTDIYTGISGPTSIGPTNSIEFATSALGDISGVDLNTFLFVPGGYISGNPLSGSATWSGTTLSGLGITPGTYTWNWGSGPTADSFSITASVPEPSSWALMACGFGLVAFSRFRALRGII